VHVGESPINGLGVFAGEDLPGRRKLGELSGHRVPLPQAWRQVERRAKIYMIELSPHEALDCTRGNAFKHLNHSCRPNCYLRICQGRGEVYTLRPVPAGAELTVDYGITPHVGGMVCLCGAPDCRGSL
jgi:SET domain-containing protein